MVGRGIFFIIEDENRTVSVGSGFSLGAVLARTFGHTLYVHSTDE